MALGKQERHRCPDTGPQQSQTGFAELAAPLYPLTKNGILFAWGDKEQRAFDQIKRALLSAPALGLPDVTKPFHLYVAENKGIAKGVLTQKLGPWNRPVAYLSKKLDPVATGWPACLKITAAVAALVKDADKLTLEQNLTITAPHALKSVIRQPPDRWLTNARMTHYQALLLNSDRIKFTSATGLNPATLLPDPDLEGTTIIHDCQEVLAAAHGSRPDLMDQPLPDANITWFTDGSSFLEEGKRQTGAAVVDGKEVIWAAALPQGTSAQRAELIAMTRALELAENKKVNIYTDSRYAFATSHVHGAIYQQRGLLTSAGKEIKNKEKTVALLAALMLPAKVSIIHCPGHQKDNTPVTRGNNMADRVARKMALGEIILELSDKSPGEPNDRGITPPAITKDTLSPQQAKSMLQQIHRWTHLGTKKMVSLLHKTGYDAPGLTKLAEQIARECIPCQQVNSHKGKLESGKGSEETDQEPIGRSTSLKYALEGCWDSSWSKRRCGPSWQRLTDRNTSRGSSLPSRRFRVRPSAPNPDARASVERTIHRPAHHPHGYKGRRHRCLDSRLTRKSCARVCIIIGMAGPKDQQPTQAQAPAIIRLITLTLLPLLAVSNFSPHLPQRLTWQVISQTGDIIWSVSHTAAPWTWWPDLFPDVCKLAIGAPYWDLEEHYDQNTVPSVTLNRGDYSGMGCHNSYRRSRLRAYPFYVCPGSHRHQSLNYGCGGTGSFYCQSWGCETTGDTYWKPTSSWDFIKVMANYTHHEDLQTFVPECSNWCHPLKISFSEPGKKNKNWINGHSWGIRFYKGGYDDGLLMTILLKIETPTPVPMGPNPEIGHSLLPLAPPTMLPGIKKTRLLDQEK
ncbi:uncharacterized protein [Kogia breviceps]|uniref:uncharacterized protein n=1 Tax=Kogia breviceps TaxID=27615 RepID=UPI0034D1D091